MLHFSFTIFCFHKGLWYRLLLLDYWNKEIPVFFYRISPFVLVFQINFNPYCTEQFKIFLGLLGYTPKLRHGKLYRHYNYVCLCLICITSLVDVIINPKCLQLVTQMQNRTMGILASCVCTRRISVSSGYFMWRQLYSSGSADSSKGHERSQIMQVMKV